MPLLTSRNVPNTPSSPKKDKIVENQVKKKKAYLKQFNLDSFLLLLLLLILFFFLFLLLLLFSFFSF